LGGYGFQNLKTHKKNQVMGKTGPKPKNPLDPVLRIFFIEIPKVFLLFSFCTVSIIIIEKEKPNVIVNVFQLPK
jgi:hypothetical protein